MGTGVAGAVVLCELGGYGCDRLRADPSEDFDRAATGRKQILAYVVLAVELTADWLLLSLCVSMMLVSQR